MRLMNKLMAVCLMTVPLLFVGCQDEELFDAGNRVVEGIPTQVTLGYASLESTIETRAAQEADYENRIENIYLFVFNSAGGRVDLNRNLFTSDADLYPEDDDPSLGTGTLQFVCPSLNGATIVAIANVTNGSTVTAYDVTPAELDAIETLDELKAKVMKMNASSIFRSALFMMTGYAVNEAGSTSIDIAGNESGEGKQLCTLQLERTDAKVEVHVSSNTELWKDLSFRPQTWRVVEVPMQSLILPDEQGDADGDDCDYFTTVERPFETLESNATGTLDAGGGFVFYMPENRKTPLQEVKTDGTPAEQYALREKWVTEDVSNPSKPEQNVQNISFAYAHPHSTYLEIVGHLTYTGEGNRVVDATTKYYVHLGYEGGNPNDYNTLRNKHYIYNIEVKGINNIEVEVTGGDPRPGHEGDVIYSKNGIFYFDCHYDRRLITLNKADIAADGLSWSVSTPYSDGVHKVGDVIPETMRDYRWVKFAINSDYGVRSNRYVKYPGDQNYDDPFVDDGTDNQSSPYYKNSYPNARLLDINQLLTRLRNNINNENGNLFDGNGNVAITAFVDEYLYIKDPLTDDATEDPSLWKKCVNKPDRLMHIISNDSRIYSADGNSSVVHSIYTFKQKSIRTIYNLESDKTTAWGLETVMEGDRFTAASSSWANDMDNGRSNTWTYLRENGGGSNLKWTDVLNTEEHYALNWSKSNVFYATLMRNRDLNGDNIVQENEIRWYLAAINQLTDIYIGEYALDQESRLYPWDPQAGDFPPNNGNSVYWHYASSTYDSKQGGPFVVWAEEGPSRGNYNASLEDNGSYYAYRCLRNLGISLDDIQATPTPLITYETNSDGSCTFDLSRLDSKALRSNYVAGAGIYPVHNEKSQNNLPYVRFTVSRNRYPSKTNNWEYYQTTNPCEKDGYRVPNMRELLIYSSRLYSGNGGDSGFHLLSYTGFSLSSYRDGLADYRGRLGYSYNTSDGSMGPSNDNYGYVRGVRDEQ